jgi:transcriptional regulator with XRE-family HTH domain
MFESKKFAEKIMMKRVIKRRISIRKLADEIGVNFVAISRYERQEVIPDTINFLLICKWLDCQPLEFLNEATESEDKVCVRCGKHIDHSNKESNNYCDVCWLDI